jgi:hypothetical protein
MTTACVNLSCSERDNCTKFRMPWSPGQKWDTFPGGDTCAQFERIWTGKYLRVDIAQARALRLQSRMTGPPAPGG